MYYSKHESPLLPSVSWADPEGEGVRTPPPPLKWQRYRVSLQYWSGPLVKSLSYQSNIQCWAIMCQPAKRHWNGVSLQWRFAGGPMMAQLKRYLDPLSPHQLKKLNLDPRWQNVLDLRMCLYIVHGFSFSRYINPSWTNAFFLLVWYNTLGMVHCRRFWIVLLSTLFPNRDITNNTEESCKLWHWYVHENLCKMATLNKTKNWFLRPIIAECRSKVLPNDPRGSLCTSFDLH